MMERLGGMDEAKFYSEPPPRAAPNYYCIYNIFFKFKLTSHEKYVLDAAAVRRAVGDAARRRRPGNAGALPADGQAMAAPWRQPERLFAIRVQCRRRRHQLRWLVQDGGVQQGR